MAYYIFSKNSEGMNGSIVKIAENINDLNTLNINKNDYSILEDNIQDFDQIKLNIKIPIKYIQNNVFFEENITNTEFPTSPGAEEFDKLNLKRKINDYCALIKNFLKNNPNHIQFQKWNNYFNQLNNLNLDNLTYPLGITLEQYFKNNNQPYFNILQLP